MILEKYANVWNRRNFRCKVELNELQKLTKLNKKKKDFSLFFSSTTYEQCTTTGPSCPFRLSIELITCRTNDNIEVGWLGTPWSGHDM